MNASRHISACGPWQRTPSFAMRSWIGSLWSARLWFAVFYLLVFEVWFNWLAAFLPAPGSACWHSLWHEATRSGFSLLQMVYWVHSMLAVMLVIDSYCTLRSREPPDRRSRTIAYLVAIAVVMGKTLSAALAASL